ncbi:sugar transferase [Celeribacter marinus]|uniref:Bacterial sugar transferase n=1 Tax=Celeribacter marinus TaxID=1397108 RepID=A0A0N9ZS77_9RHOB|nr:sugar transferase [Celeribacter marinus]ALI56707.1 bacterial sugar transferase [Celeribacter marinus]SFK63594.1 Sugar transferase involved in LPS biosynthesis (colanic, teichoic acid) [Celeribacter marinus]
MTFFNEPVAVHRRMTRSLYRLGGKRLFDILFVIVIAPIVVPLVILFALIVRRDSGPAFFSQTRVGKGGVPFTCYKLRTMVVDAEHVLAAHCAGDPLVRAQWEAYQKLTDDPRITCFGRILRATSLDELPQFWNVLRGDMSLIGPRPFTVDQEPLYSNSRASAYYRLRPGISGAWQVSSRNSVTFAERLAFDEEYDATLSVSEDLKVLLKTVAVVLRHQGQ